MSKELGKQGEEFAVEYLQRQGYEIIHTNWECKMGEIDIIATDGETTCIIEVKTRTTDLEHPFEAITPRKQSKLRKLAQWYLIDQFGTDEENVRFDVVAVYNEDDQMRAELLQNAF